ncbi:hypothetical protein OOU_Y34scaffold00882g1 [Pyricularia oryzae Y34]|uniref:Uncharacterized protein n=2 Tax=Pyricularia oryzae TaxID=318829 RepID=A0AA97PGI5_PYRO3|nr:hypothetical protein OOU_Y34scaffold00882g1 [Pyricularia oryzae Y34]
MLAPTANEAVHCDEWLWLDRLDLTQSIWFRSDPQATLCEPG